MRNLPHKNSAMERILCQYLSNKSSVLQINTICFAKKNSTFKQTQSDLQIQNSIWEKMQTYGQIYVLCVTTVRLICLFMRKLGLIFSQMRAGWFSHKCVQADFLTNACWLIFSQMRVGWLHLYFSITIYCGTIYCYTPALLWMLNNCINIYVYSISRDPTEDKRYREWISFYRERLAS